MDIPIVVVCFNNGRYVQNTLLQIKRINPLYYKNIIIMDNNSGCPETVAFLKSVDVRVHYTHDNQGPWVNQVRNPELYHMLPDRYIVTDPDLKLNPKLPTNFIEIMSELFDYYDCEKLGMALDISDYDKMYPGIYCRGKTIQEFEEVYWKERVEHPDYELYHADIDTTFCMFSKHMPTVDRKIHKIRIAGNFTAKHLPWYVDNPLLNVHDNYMANRHRSWISTIAGIVVDYTESHYWKLPKRDQWFFIEKREDDPNIAFWRDAFPYWENYTFDVLDRFLDPQKVFLNLGGWVGATSIYACRQSQHVYVVEADTAAFQDLTRNLKNNCRGNYTCIQRAVFPIGQQVVPFGKNLFNGSDRMNDSTCHIYADMKPVGSGCEFVFTITLKDLLDTYRIDPCTVSLVQVDIEGGEEYLLDDLYEMHHTHDVPILLHFHYSWWKNKDLDRFSWLSTEQKDKIRLEPFCQILLE